jgi:hypothetical protein
MFGPFRSSFSRSAMSGRLLTLVYALSIVVGLTGAWLTRGPASLYCMASISVVGLLVVHLLRVSDVRRIGYEVGVLSGVHAMCWMGLILSFGLLGVLWVCALIATTTPVRALWEEVHGQAVALSAQEGNVPGRTSGAWTATTSHAEARPDPSSIRRAVLELPDLDLDALCMVWRRSYFQLLDAGLTPSTAAVVEYRQGILDEIDHRDPRGLSRWLASETRASGNPLPYLQARTASTDDQGAPMPDPQSHHENDGTA